MRVGEVPVLLLDRHSISAHRLLDLASRVQRVAEIVMSFSVAAAALLDRGSIRSDGFVDFTKVVESDSQVVPGCGKAIAQSSRRAPETCNRVFKLASFIQCKSQVVMRDRIVGQTLDGRAV